MTETSGNAAVQASAISLVKSGCSASRIAGESAQHTIKVLTAPLMTVIITEQIQMPITKPILNSSSKKHK
jgi:hypothetical protein